MQTSFKDSHDAWLSATDEPTWLTGLRKRSLEAFEQHGFPTKKVEAWTYSSTARIARTAYVHDHGALFEALAGGLVGKHALSGAAAELVFVNGAFAAGLSRVPDLEGVSITPLGEALRAARDGDLAARLDPAFWPALPHAARTTIGPYRRSAPPEGDKVADRPESAFDLLNTAFLQDGVVLSVDKDTVVPGPIHVILVSFGAESPIASHPRLLVDVGSHAELTLVERHVGGGDESTLVNALTDAVVHDGGHLRHHLWRLDGPETAHVEHVKVRIGRDARYDSHVAALGGDWFRNDLDVRFTATGGEALCTGVTVADGKQHVDHHTWLRHEVPHCTSREIYKGVYGDRSRGVFNGMVYIAKDAQKTDADLSNKNLLLGERAQIQTKPELEIHADDVKAAHGCTIGQLDPAQLAYLRTRGIEAEHARRMLTQGFVVDLLEEIEDVALREAVSERVRERLAQLHGGSA